MHPASAATTERGNEMFRENLTPGIIALSHRARLVGLVAQIAVTAFAAAQSTQAGVQQIPLMDRQKEISLALSACPLSVRDKAAVYVLEKSGYVKARDSQNGFIAIVERTVPGTQAPQCMG